MKLGIETRWRLDFPYPSIRDPGPNEPSVQWVKCVIVKGEGKLCLIYHAARQERRISGFAQVSALDKMSSKMQGSTVLLSQERVFSAHKTRVTE
jgi:hypothetical protein